MAKTESQLWKDLKKELPDWDLVRHEDRITLGIPDVSFAHEGIHGWIELKVYKSFPKNPSKPIPFRNLKSMQKKFLRRRDRIAGHVFILTWIGDLYVLTRGRFIYNLGSWTADQFLTRSLWYGPHLAHIGPQLIK